MATLQDWDVIKTSDQYLNAGTTKQREVRQRFFSDVVYPDLRDLGASGNAITFAENKFINPQEEPTYGDYAKGWGRGVLRTGAQLPSVAGTLIHEAASRAEERPDLDTPKRWASLPHDVGGYLYSWGSVVGAGIESFLAPFKRAKATIAERTEVDEEIAALADGFIKEEQKKIASWGLNPKNRDGWETFFESLGAAQASLAMSVGVSVLTGSPHAGAIAFAALEKANMYQQAREAGLPLKESGEISTGLAAVVGVTEFAGLDFIMTKYGSPVRNLMVRALGEGLQELVQEAAGETVEAVTFEQDKTFQEAAVNSLYAGLIGTLSGAPASVAMDIMGKNGLDDILLKHNVDPDSEIAIEKKRLFAGRLQDLGRSMAERARNVLKLEAREVEGTMPTDINAINAAMEETGPPIQREVMERQMEELGLRPLEKGDVVLENARRAHEQLGKVKAVRLEIEGQLEELDKAALPKSEKKARTDELGRDLSEVRTLEQELADQARQIDEQIAGRVDTVKFAPRVVEEKAGMVAEAITEELEQGTLPLEDPTPADIPFSEDLANMLRTSTEMADVQREIKRKYGFDVSIQELQSWQAEFKGGASPDVTKRILDGISDTIRGREPGGPAAFGAERVAQALGDEDLQDLVGPLVRSKEAARNLARDVKEYVHSLELPQNYLYAYDDSRPLAESIIDAFQRLTRDMHDIGMTREAAIRLPENPEAIARLAVIANMDPEMDIESRLQGWLEQGVLTDRDIEAFRALERMRFYIQEEITRYIDQIAKDPEEAQQMIDEMLKNPNWISESRREGKAWVTAREITAPGQVGQMVFVARVATLKDAEAIAKKIEQTAPMLKVETHEHSRKLREQPTFASLGDVFQFIEQEGIDPTSEAARLIIDTYKSLSPTLSSLIRRNEIAGYRTDWRGIMEAMTVMARSAARRSWRRDIGDLKSEYLPYIKDDFRYNVALKYLNALAEPTPMDQASKLMAGVRAWVYFGVLANKATYVVQNLTEPLWAIARLPKLNDPGKFMAPLEDEYKQLIERGRKEGVFDPIFISHIIEEGSSALGSWFARLDVLGRFSEQFSSRMTFNVGLRLARDQGKTGEDAYRAGYRYLWQVGKPFYHQANSPIITLDKGMGHVRRYGLTFTRWVADWWNKTLRAGGEGAVDLVQGLSEGDKAQVAKAGESFSKVLKTGLTWILLGGLGSVPGARPILRALDLHDPTDDPRDMGILDRFLMGGIIGALGVDPGFLVPKFYRRGLRGVGAFYRNIFIMQSKVNRIVRDWQNYGGLTALLGNLPLAGFQYLVSGGARVQKGVRERRGGRPSVTFQPKTARERVLTAVGLTPIELGETFQRREELRDLKRTTTERTLRNLGLK